MIFGLRPSLGPVIEWALTHHSAWCLCRGSAIAKIVGNNVLQYPDVFDHQVTMWVYEEIINGQKLTDIINTRHENTKYLPGIRLPENIIAVPDVVQAAKDATVLVFVIPHQVRPCI
jgi:glycerol-3-phosphate dehydrogenase (NAD+)